MSLLSEIFKQLIQDARQTNNMMNLLREQKEDTLYVYYMSTGSPLIRYAMEGIFSSVIISSVDVVLVYRIWILYGKSHFILYTLSFVVFEAEFITVTTLVVTAIASLKGVLPTYFKFYVITMLIVAIINFSLTIHACSVTFFKNNWQYMPAMMLFLRDGLFWFAVLFALTLSQTIILTVDRVSLSQLLIGPTVAISAIIGCRVHLNILQVVLKPSLGNDGVDTFELDKLSHLRVAHGSNIYME
ncbi:hypothetical protein BDQ17DRAFT_1412208 [Cyathus striatus]|nr:hypothetical protein BDQ17DRAFT_1412208 [Cyathus striatus]